MPAAVVKGILISIGIIAALGYAVYENPEVQQWIEEQRRNLAQLLRSIGDELDPQSRREAEAFAFGGQDLTTRDATNNETSRDAAAVTTGRSPTSTSAVRRINIPGTSAPEEREERQRLGREYLARRNQQMMEMQERRRIGVFENSSATSSLDSLLDEEGKLKSEDNAHGAIKLEVNDAEPVASSSAMSNPFSDPIERSETPRPTVPSKIKLEHLDPTPAAESVAESIPEMTRERSYAMPGSMPEPVVDSRDASYEDQLAIALALSKEESASTRQAPSGQYSDDIRQAIEASLRDAQPHLPRPFSDLYASHNNWIEDSALQHSTLDSSEEDLYNVTPHLTRASLATLNAQHPSLAPTLPYQAPGGAALIRPPEASFHSALDRPAITRDEDSPGAKTPTEASFAFESDVDGTESFASVSPAEADHVSATRSRTMSDESAIEVEDQASDVISEDGIATPDSWTEVGSQDGGSDTEMRQPVAIS